MMNPNKPTPERDPLKKVDDNPANRDPISGAKGAHPVGTGLGAAGGGLAGAAIGSVAGPIGTAAGAVIGAVAGGLGGKAAGEAIDPTVEDAYWEKAYRTRPYTSETTEFKEYRPAYRFGWENATRSNGKTFDELSPSLERDWDRTRSKDSTLTWARAKDAVRDAWDRVATPKQKN
ncbi:MAG: hypothetical protein PSX37_00130 [bacterium]|nr:hypothetical protein [bacterium]